MSWSGRCIVSEADGETREYPEGTPYRVIAGDFQKNHENDIVLVFVDGKLQELHKTSAGGLQPCLRDDRG